MINKVSKNVTRQKRHLRIRQTLVGTAVKPRLNVFRSIKQIYAQIIDDTTGRTLCSASSLDKEINVKNGSNVAAATEVGTLIAKRALEPFFTVISLSREEALHNVFPVLSSMI